MISVQGVGGLAGGMTAGAIARRVGDGLLTAAGLAATVVFSLLVAVPADAVVLAGAVCCGLGLPWVVVGAMTVTQKNTPPAMMGRVGGAVDLSVQAPQAVGVAVGAAVVDHVFYRDLCFLIAAGVGVMAVYLATRKEQRMPRKTGVEEADAGEDGFQVRDAAGHPGDIRDVRGGVA
jgi:MFS family permease